MDPATEQRPQLEMPLFQWRPAGRCIGLSPGAATSCGLSPSPLWESEATRGGTAAPVQDVRGGGMSGGVFYLIAGEPSGDRLGAALIAGLRQLEPGAQFVGVGGRQMQAAGLDSLFDIAELGVMGLAEILPRLPQLLRRIAETTRDVLALRPDALITIDSPGFGLRVAQKVRAEAPSIRTIHYVAPSVWAWRPGRARHMARYIDHVLALLPFEPPYMTAAGMTCDFVGHPIVERPAVTDAEVAAWRAQYGLAPNQALLALAPGSRAGEVRRLMPVFSEVVAAQVRQRRDLAVVIPVAETVVDAVLVATADLAARPILVLPEQGEAAKATAFAAAHLGLVASGTVSLEMAAAGTPFVAAYRLSWLTAAIVRRVAKVNTANLVNLVAGQNVVPEFLQEYCTAPAVSAALDRLMLAGPERAAQEAVFPRVMSALGREGAPPSLRAARSVLAALRR